VTESATSASRDYGRFDELAEEFAERYRRGERPSLQEYIDRLPEMANEIREMFPALVEVERAKGDASDETHAPAGPAVPQLREVGDYRIVREVGRGGMGVVYEAEQISLGRRVALKVLPGHIVGDRKSLERFRREAKAAARLHHTNIVPVFEVGRDRDIAFYAMQFIQGQGLDQVIDELRRLRGRDGKASSNEHTEFGRLANRAVGFQTAFLALERSRTRQLEDAAKSILTGRVEADGLNSNAAEASADTQAIGNEPINSDFDPDTQTRELTSSMSPHLGRRSPEVDGSSSAVFPGGTSVSSVDSSARRQPFFRSVAHIGRQTAQALAYAHSRHIVHRDIKPSNLLLDTDGVVWITDFGLAKADDDGLTQTGDLLGTLRYMAPERFRGEGDARADIYGLGLTLYELLTLEPAYETNDRLKLIEQVKNEEPTRPRSIDGRIPRDLETILLKAIDKDPARRYTTAEAMAEDLRRFLADEPIKARQVGATERFWRWARRNPTIAVLGGLLTAVLFAVTIGAIFLASRFASLARDASKSATSERESRLEADKQRAAAESARGAALAETYRAMLSEVKALRAGHPPGWRAQAIDNLARMAAIPTPRRDLVELRSEAVANIVNFDIVQAARIAGQHGTSYALEFSPDSQTLLTANGYGELHVWDIAQRNHRWGVVAPVMGSITRSSLARFLPDGGIVRATRNHRVEFLEPSGEKSARAPIGGGSSQAVYLNVDRGGRVLVVGWDDGRITAYDLATGATRRSVSGNPQAFALSADGRVLAFIGPSGEVMFQSTDADDSPVPKWSKPVAAKGLAFSPDGKTIATYRGSSATLWDVASGRELATLRGHKEAIQDLAFSPDGNWVATASNDYTTRVWDVRTGQVLSVLSGSWFMMRVAFSPDGRYIATSTDEPGGKVEVYELVGRRERLWLAGHRAGTQSLAFHPQQPLLASAADDHDIIVWDPQSGGLLRRWVAHNSFVVVLAFSRDGSLLASGGGGNEEVRLWDTETGTLRRELKGHRGRMARGALAFDSTGTRLASGDEAGMLILWDLITGGIIRREAVGKSPVRSIAFLDEDRYLLAAEERGATISLIDLKENEPPRRLIQPNGWNRLVVDSRRGRAVVADFAGGLNVVSLPQLAIERRVEKAHNSMIWSIAMTRDGKLMATADAEGHVVLRDADTLEALANFPTWTGAVKDLAFDPSGRWLAMVGADSDVGLWDLDQTREQLTSMGLSWDQPAPEFASSGDVAAIGDRPDLRVTVISVPTSMEDLDRAIELRPDDSRQRFVRGNLLAKNGKWKDALDDLREGLARDESDTTNWMAAAVLYLQLNDEQGYRRHAQAMLEKFAATGNVQAAERTAKVGALAAPSPEEASRLIDLADLAVTKGAASVHLPWFQLARGMAAYRAGQFRDAANWLQKVRDASSSTPECKAAAIAFLAMSQSRLGGLADARASLDVARQLLKGKRVGGAWHDWLIGEMALREAETIVGNPG
jgi:WD40 repeat protein